MERTVSDVDKLAALKDELGRPLSCIGGVDRLGFRASGLKAVGLKLGRHTASKHPETKSTLARFPRFSTKTIAQRRQTNKGVTPGMPSVTLESNKWFRMKDSQTLQDGLSQVTELKLQKTPAGLIQNPWNALWPYSPLILLGST